MKMLPLLLVSTSLFAASPTIYMAPPATVPTSSEEKLSKASDKLSTAEKSAAARKSSSKESNEMMIISPEGRAKDIKAAIEFLKKRSPTTKPSIKMSNGSTITGILDVEVMPGGTVLIFQVASLKGIQYQVENIENINSIDANGT